MPTRRARFTQSLAIIILCLIASPAALSARVVHSEHSRVELVPVDSAIVPGKALRFVLIVESDPDWHTYFANPGDSGERTRIRWDLPNGIVEESFEWPVPERIPTPPFMTYGYSGRTLFPVTLRVGNNFDQSTANIEAKVTWLECKEICLPGKGRFSFDFRVESEAMAPSYDSYRLWNEARASIPLDADSSGIEARFAEGEEHFELTIKGPSIAAIRSESDAYFFSREQGLLEHAAPQSVTINEGSLFLQLPMGPQVPEQLENLQGVLVLGSGDERLAWEVSATASSAMAGLPIELGLAILGALAGGLILNLMPCVLPVLSLKVFALIGQRDKPKRLVLEHATLYTAGIVATFLALATLMIVLQSTGRAIGWGFQLQSPIFVGMLATILLLFALNLLGVFEITLPAFLSRATGGEMNHTTAFGSGVFAVLLATPCTAPFMGAAMGFAVTQSWWILLLVFTALGIGLALPYLLLALFPSLLRFVPKPGAWMETLKQLLGFALLATMAWLVYLFLQLTDTTGFILIHAALLIAAIAAWMYGRFRDRLALRWTSVFLLLASVALVVVFTRAPAQASSMTEDVAGWERWSSERVDELVADSRPVFVDFTADWCLSCKVNKAVALDRENVRDAFARNNVVLLRADWTNEDAAIANELASHGRSGIPLYLYYAPGNSEPEILPELLTPEIVIEAVDR